MDDNITKMKNEILRKIKFYKKKERGLPDFKRKVREEILGRRKAALQENEEAQAHAEAGKKERKPSKEKKAGKGQAESQSHFTSQKGGIRSRGTHQESGATLAQASEGEDLNSLASGLTASRKALNINVQSAS